MVLGGGAGVEFMKPMRRIFRRLKRLERNPHMLDVSLLMCHIWNDSPDLGWAVYVLADEDEAVAESVADHIADLAWGVKDEMPPQFSGAVEAIEGARSKAGLRRFGAVCFTDASDVVGAGSTGENTHLVRALLEHGTGLLSYAPIRDAVAVDALWNMAEGLEVELKTLGGRIDSEMNPPLECVQGRVGRRRSTVRHGRMVALDCGHVQLVITELAPYTMKPSFYRKMGLEPWRADIMVVKSFFHFRIFYALVMRKTYVVKTYGLTDLNAVERIAFNTPVHPLSVLEDWRASDRARRGLTPSG